MGRHTSFLIHLLLSKREKKSVPPLFPSSYPCKRICVHAAQRRKAFLRFFKPPRASNARASRKINIARKRTDQITRTPVKMRPDGDATLFEASGCSKIFTFHLFDAIFHATPVLLCNAFYYILFLYVVCIHRQNI